MRVEEVESSAFYTGGTADPAAILKPDPADRFLLYRVPESDPIEDWSPVRFYAPDDDFGHWPRAGFAHRCMSEYARDVVNANLGPKDRIEWLPVVVDTPSRGELTYYLPHSTEPVDVYHSATTYGPSGVPMLWILDADKVMGHEFFIPPGTGATVMRGSMIIALIEAGISDLYFEPARVA